MSYLIDKFHSSEMDQTTKTAKLLRACGSVHVVQRVETQSDW